MRFFDNLKSIMLRIGYRIESCNIDYAETNYINPFIIKYITNYNYNKIVYIPVCYIRDLYWFKMNRSHPFVDTLFNFKNSGYEIAKETLNTYYKINQPSNALEYCGLEEQEAPGLINLEPIKGLKMPWKNGNIKDTGYKGILNAEHNEAKRDGYSNALGSKYFGPVNEIKLNYELNRLINTYNSILDEGYLRSNTVDGDITGSFLIKNANKWVFLVNQGHHRIAALTSLGYNSVPVRITGNCSEFIRLDEYIYWPQVINKVYNKDGAKKIFNKILQPV